MQRYSLIRYWMNQKQFDLPEDPRKIREWSTIMAITGVLNAIDRGTIKAGTDVLVHGAGLYTEDDYQKIPPSDVHTLEKENAIEQIASTLKNLY